MLDELTSRRNPWDAESKHGHDPAERSIHCRVPGGGTQDLAARERHPLTHCLFGPRRIIFSG
jgi:hypothetical protein